MDAKNIGLNIKRTRKERGLTQAELAQIHASTVDAYHCTVSNLKFCGYAV